jgi:hypothetical protein
MGSNTSTGFIQEATLWRGSPERELKPLPLTDWERYMRLVKSQEGHWVGKF